MHYGVDCNEQSLWQHEPAVLETLLADNTTHNNILWATDDYEEYGDSFKAECNITVSQILEHGNIIKPRVAKSRNEQLKRTKDNAEVFTPSWVCNAQNNLVDDAWFGRNNVFNVEYEKSWKATSEPIVFSENNPEKTWQHYVDEKRLEITCGEAPYLVSRYDTVTGKTIELAERIGLLDRKLRVVGEQCKTSDDWLMWARRAVESIYGFEFQGDNLLLARENILMTYQDYRESTLGAMAVGEELLGIAHVIAWNIWQMDGLTQLPPYKHEESVQNTLDIFEEAIDNVSQPCTIYDWRSKKTVSFKSLLKEE